MFFQRNETDDNIASRILPWLVTAVLFGGCGQRGISESGESRNRSPGAVAKAQPASSPASVKGDGGDQGFSGMESKGESQFVGSAFCAECHREQHASYSQTDHSRSLRRVSRDEELVGQRFKHEPSSTEFAVDVDDAGAIVHTSTIVLEGGPAMVTASKKIDLVVGSGAFAKSYLTLNQDGCFQSPLTYYIGKRGYAMSPGYDRASHQGFTRQISDQCLFCHAGSVNRAGENPNRFEIQELSIGCERCHGAGRSHVAFHQHSKHLASNSGVGMPSDEEAKTSARMVDPSRLTRSQVQSLCAQCHLQGDVTIYQAGQDAWGFKPGDELQDNRAEYSVDGEEKETAFIGHFAQLDQSSCFRSSEEMSCVTCHNPHHVEPDSQLPALRIKQCLSCHQDEQCGVKHAIRVAKNQNQCVDCHMPKGKSEVPHATITNHRIAVYGEFALHEDAPERQASSSDSSIGLMKKSNESVPTPIALLDKSDFGSTQRQLNESIALGNWLLMGAKPEAVTFQKLKTALERLEAAIESHRAEVHGARLTVANLIEAMLSRFDSNLTNENERLELWRKAADHAARCESSANLSLLDQMSATAVLANAAYEYGQFENAAARYRRLTALRTLAADWYNLGLCYGKLSRFVEAEAAFLEAIRLDPTYSAPCRSLSRLYSNSDPSRAQFYAARANQLEKAVAGAASRQ